MDRRNIYTIIIVIIILIVILLYIDYFVADILPGLGRGGATG